MTADADGRGLLPIACTLGPTDGAKRVQEWKKVLGDAACGREIEPGRLTLRFRDRPDVREELTRLVLAERDCCAFLGWDLVEAAGEWRVEITGREEDLRSLSLS